MKSNISKTLMTVGTLASVMLSGCTTLLRNESVGEVIDNNVVRMEVSWGETEEYSFTPSAYNVEASQNNWTKEANQYRWIKVHAILRHDVWGRAFRIGLVPDQLPLLKVGDLVDVYLPPFADVNYGMLKAPIILKLICKDADSACKTKSEKEIGGRNEVVSKGKPDMSNLTFSKVYDLGGKRPK